MNQHSGSKVSTLLNGGRFPRLQPSIVGNQAAYIPGWMKQIKSNETLLISASSQTQWSTG
jgi:hypothetical protein